jgi:hypothetical protein
MSRRRKIALAAVLLLQTVYFFRFLERPPRVIADNFRYDVPARQLAHGHGFTMPYEQAPDPVVRGWACAKHAELCDAAEYPVAIYPPGYSYFLAGIYTVAGTSLWAVEIVQWLLLLVLVVLFDRVAARELGERGHLFCMVVLGAYPFLARQAGMIMSDHLHTVALFGAFAALALMRPGIARGVTFGLLIAFATLIRPYSLFVIPVVMLAPAMWRAQMADRREWLAAGVAAALPFVLWIARNAYWFGHFIPLSTTGLGASLYSLALEGRVGNIYDPANAAQYRAELGQFGDWGLWTANRALGEAATAWLSAHPAKVAALLLLHLPKLWISVGTEGAGLSLASLAPASYLAVLFLLGVVGLVLKRKDGRWRGWLLLIAVYWLFLLPSSEARRTLPLRLPLLLFAGVAVEAWWVRRASRSPS